MLLNDIQEKLNQARKEKNSKLITILTTLFGEAQMVGKNKGNTITSDEDVIKIIKKFNNNIEETISLISDLQKKEDLLFEKEVISQFLPKQLSKEELEKEIDLILSAKDKNLGKKLIGIVNQELKIKFNGSFNSKDVQEILNNKI